MKAIYKNLASILLDETLDIPSMIKQLEKEIATLTPYNHDANTIAEACNTSTPSMATVKVSSSGKLSKIIEQMEDQFTKRQLAIILTYKFSQEGEIENPKEKALKSIMQALKYIGDCEDSDKSKEKEEDTDPITQLLKSLGAVPKDKRN